MSSPEERHREAQVAFLAEKLYVAQITGGRHWSTYDAFEQAERFMEMKEERWKQVSK